MQPYQQNAGREHPSHACRWDPRNPTHLRAPRPNSTRCSLMDASGFALNCKKTHPGKPKALIRCKAGNASLHLEVHRIKKRRAVPSGFAWLQHNNRIQTVTRAAVSHTAALGFHQLERPLTPEALLYHEDFKAGKALRLNSHPQPGFLSAVGKSQLSKGLQGEREKR